LNVFAFNNHHDHPLSVIKADIGSIGGHMYMYARITSDTVKLNADISDFDGPPVGPPMRHFASKAAKWSIFSTILKFWAEWSVDGKGIMQSRGMKFIVDKDYLAPSRKNMFYLHVVKISFKFVYTSYRHRLLL
jgi:hypothetical protein